MPDESARQAVLAFDVGGTKLAAGLIDRCGRLLAYRKSPVLKPDFRDTVRQLREEAERCLAAAGLHWGGVRAAGVILPGIAGAQGGTAWAPNLWGDVEVPLAGELARSLPVAVVMEGDRSGYVLGEQWLGVARGMENVVFIAVGTGIGAGILAGSQVIRGAIGSAGAAGWMALSPAFRDEYVRVGCWEAEASGPALARKAGVSTAEEAVAAARRGEPRACAAVEDVSCWLAMGVANLISLLNPQMIVLGGGLMAAGDLFLEPVRREAKRWAQPRAALQTRIELSALGERAGLFGAARLAWESAANAPE